MGVNSARRASSGPMPGADGSLDRNLGCVGRVDGDAQGVDHSGHAHHRQHQILGGALFANHPFMGVEALSAAIDGGNGQRPELEVHLFHAVAAQAVHAQAGSHSGNTRDSS